MGDVLQISDEILMKAYKRGEEEAFNSLYGRYSSMVYAYARKRLNSSEVDDFYQSVWRHLHEKRENYADQPFAPWFFVLIRNLLVDEYRSKGRRKNLLDTDPTFDTLESDTLESDRLQINDLLEKLPQETAILVRKYYLEGFDYEDLEKDTGMSQSSLRKRLSRALQGLRDKFEG
jgi:RNA polymerase sigma-70 factor (ECF subfamily)